MHRFFGEIIDNTAKILNPDYFHLKKVLRAKNKDKILVFSPLNEEYLCEIKDITKTEIICSVIKKIEKKKCIETNVFFPLMKRKAMDTAVRICTEFGVSSFTPIITECSLKKYNDIDKVKKRWMNIHRESRKQSGSNIDMIMNKPDRIEKFISFKNINIVPQPYTETKTKLILKSDDKINLWLGPEAGFSEKEIELFKKYNFIFIKIAETVLKTETALAAGLGIIRYCEINQQIT
ncbi:MAG: RsmE family RNA methyltransferase [Candidatus Hydrogenedentota bacterium]